MATFTLRVDTPGPSLHVMFDRAGDKFAHRVARCGASGECEMLLFSVEGSDDQIWPASPVIQEVHLEDRADGSRVALCVGKAGKSHWSLAVQLAANGREAIFDVACRVREVPGELRSTYQVVEPHTAEQACIECLQATIMQSTDVQSTGKTHVLSPERVEQNTPQTVAWQYAVKI